MAEAPGDLGSEEQEDLLAEEGTGLTTQWSVEDEEEVAREQRRRERERMKQDQDEGGPDPDQSEQEALLGGKPSEAPELDEDEGFGDWSQKSEQQRQQHWVEEGALDAGEGPEGKQDRSCQQTCGNDISDGLRQASVHLEQLGLSQEGSGPEEPVQGHQEVAEAGEAEEHQRCQQPKTPSPLGLEGNTRPSSPPLSPTTKLADRTESLNRSIEKSNTVKKSQPALPIARIDERLEQYTQAIESAGRTPRLSRQASIELPSMAVASTKSLWETGEMQTLSSAKTPSCKDIVAGDMSKKSLWELRGDPTPSSSIKATPSGKRYKFVATGHGKYEKVLVDEGPVP
ncbi:lymphocyte-specific protein 1 isoform X1 [Ictidomys tridecemlineatus]|uniref:lymphocyte-specific protein 1 isoform X2 n=1 Tax=Ictidomys tridecemlineatus TaxID=43179 RepID=UPI000681D53E|nr:lymphocyte-specific protein 1 isoform X2 [Ictidomys tridecemlineatus]KAG3284379.1 lymphocyte-specific protein 1, transcript variant X1 [Ictidomys tridecemlineatus]